jgi:hypothetical protein
MSINDLLKAIKNQSTNPDPVSGKLDNPDIPELKMKNKKPIKDQYYNTFHLKNNSGPRNGTGFVMTRNVNRSRLDIPHGSIDPNQIRRKTHPESAMPNSFINGSEGDIYTLPKSTLTSHNYVGLLKKARTSFFRYKNRFTPTSEK